MICTPFGNLDVHAGRLGIIQQHYTHKVISGQKSSVYDSLMAPRKIIFRAAVPCALLLAALSAHAGPKTKGPAPCFNAKRLDGEKFTNDAIKSKAVLLEFRTKFRRSI